MSIERQDVYTRITDKIIADVELIAHAKLFFEATKADIRYRSTQAFYSSDGDYIQMPAIEAFQGCRALLCDTGARIRALD